MENAYLRVRTTTANVRGVLPGPAHQASDSKFHQWCHERRLSPRGGAVVNIYDCRNLASNTSVKGPDADFISDSGDPHPLCVTKVGHLVGYLRQRLKSEEFHMKPFEERSCRRWDSNSRIERRFPGQSFVFHHEYPQLSGGSIEVRTITCK